nr:MAG TPA: hypothetical protein [Caudoviricetes sp.]
MTSFAKIRYGFIYQCKEVLPVIILKKVRSSAYGNVEGPTEYRRKVAKAEVLCGSTGFPVYSLKGFTNGIFRN